jgi:hypothetical protein
MDTHLIHRNYVIHFIYIDEVTNLRIGEYSENISILYQFDIHILSAYLWWIFLCSNIPAALLYWVFPNSCYARSCANYVDFLDTARQSTHKVLKRVYVAPKLKSFFRKFCGLHGNLIDRYEVAF